MLHLSWLLIWNLYSVFSVSPFILAEHISPSYTGMWLLLTSFNRTIRYTSVGTVDEDDECEIGERHLQKDQLMNEFGTFDAGVYDE